MDTLSVWSSQLVYVRWVQFFTSVPIVAPLPPCFSSTPSCYPSLPPNSSSSSGFLSLPLYSSSSSCLLSHSVSLFYEYLFRCVLSPPPLYPTSLFPSPYLYISRVIIVFSSPSLLLQRVCILFPSTVRQELDVTHHLAAIISQEPLCIHEQVCYLM